MMLVPIEQNRDKQHKKGNSILNTARYSSENTDDKHFLLIGNQNAITYKEIFPYIKEDKVWVGYRFGDMAFRVPPDTVPRKTRFWIDESGQKWRSLGNAMWLTNLDIPRRHQKLTLRRLLVTESGMKRLKKHYGFGNGLCSDFGVTI